MESRLIDKVIAGSLIKLNKMMFSFRVIQNHEMCHRKGLDV